MIEASHPLLFLLRVAMAAALATFFLAAWRLGKSRGVRARNAETRESRDLPADPEQGAS